MYEQSSSPTTHTQDFSACQLPADRNVTDWAAKLKTFSILSAKMYTIQTYKTANKNCFILYILLFKIFQSFLANLFPYTLSVQQALELQNKHASGHLYQNKKDEK